MNRSLRASASAALCVALAASAAAWPQATGATPSQGQLQSTINSSSAREQTLSAEIAHIARLERHTEKAITILEARQASAQTALEAATARAQHTQEQLTYQRHRAARLAVRLTATRDRLAALLVDRYENPPPSLVTVVFESTGFSQLLDTIDYIKRLQQSDQQIVLTVRDARAAARHERTILAALEVNERANQKALTLRRDALDQIGAGLQARENALAQAQAARQDALEATRASRRRAQKLLDQLVAAQERAATDNNGPGGPWAIPWSVVQCESGGQNLPPNYATASGYYQIIDSTWHGLGGSTPHAYQASKAEQDRLAAKLWNNGAGASNWVCAYIVGIV